MNRNLHSKSTVLLLILFFTALLPSMAQSVFNLKTGYAANTISAVIKDAQTQAGDTIAIDSATYVQEPAFKVNKNVVFFGDSGKVTINAITLVNATPQYVNVTVKTTKVAAVKNLTTGFTDYSIANVLKDNQTNAGDVIEIDSVLYKKEPKFSLTKAVTLKGVNGKPKINSLKDSLQLPATLSFNNIVLDSITVDKSADLQDAVNKIKSRGWVQLDSGYRYANLILKDSVYLSYVPFKKGPKTNVPIIDKITLNGKDTNTVVTILSGIRVRNELVLNKGRVKPSGATSTFIMMDSSIVYSTDSMSFIDGPIQQQTHHIANNIKFTYPVGAYKFNLRPITIQFDQLDTALQLLTIQYTTGSNPKQPIPNQPFNPAWYPASNWNIDFNKVNDTIYKNVFVTLHYKRNDVAHYLLRKTLGYGVAKSQGPNWADLKFKGYDDLPKTLITADTGQITNREVFTSFGNVYFGIAPYHNCDNANYQPQADFVAPNACVNGLATFTNTSTSKRGTIVMYRWDFGDQNNVTTSLAKPDTGFFSGSKKANINGTHTYTALGTYKVTLTAITDSGCVGTLTQSVTIKANPVVTLTSAPTAICNNSQATFKVNVANVLTEDAWSFTYNVTGATPAVATQTVAGTGSGTFTFNTPTLGGNTTVNLSLAKITTNVLACTTTSTDKHDIQLSPVPTFTAPAVCVGNPTIFTNTTKVLSGKLATYAWEFGDTTNGTGSVQKHTFAKAGTYTAKLKVNSGNGCVDTTVNTITVNALPVVTFTPANPKLPAVGTVNIAATPGMTAYKWNTKPVADGVNNIDADTVGTYTVTITDANSCSATGKVKVIPTPDFTAPAVCFGNKSIFTNTTKGESALLANYTWSFGDTSFAVGNIQTHVYRKIGIYNVLLTINRGNGRIDSVTKKVEVYALPVVTFNPAEPKILLGTKLEVAATPNMTAYLWNTGVTTNSIMADTVGTYSVTITDANGCKNTDKVKVEPLDDPLGIIANTITPNGDNFNDTWWIEKIGSFPGTKVEIFNRYGNEVFSSTNYNNDWNGDYKGKTLPDGTYFYVITSTSFPKVYKGHINLLKGSK